MEIPWPIKTAIRISSEVGEETWVVSNRSDPSHGLISERTPLGRSLLLSGTRKICSYFTQNGIVEYVIISFRLPGSRDDQYDDPLKYYLETYRADSTGIRHNAFLTNIFLECGFQNPLSPPGTRYCENCGASWINDYGWNCRSPVDIRNPRTSRCRKCRGCVCANCGRCFCIANFLFVKKEDDED